MGRESGTRVTWGDKTGKGMAVLETDELIFRGDFRLVIKFKDVTQATAEDGLLTLRWTGGAAGGEATFDLGDEAELWAKRILEPKPLLDKMNVKPGARVVLLGVRDDVFRDDLAQRTEEI